ncbi:UPF0149 family protein [Aliikangiella coralliicola]|uniref:UPF0149 family protein n=1 Tax=Aliikangiella coralliicola TaxID=2592383 RepID=A0A545UBU5_9GAMM|nr:UPF0149 family protein [Aliikangiella coralliicola]TQV86927.1 UPF0149 family protein [Aliikangiella coralliicola]
MSYSLEELEICFSQPSIKQSFDELYQCLGFITAVASSPDEIKPSEWMEQLVITESKRPQFDSESQVKTLSSNFTAWWNHCDAVFDHATQLELPEKIGLTASGKPNKSLVEFSSGYLKGYNWLSKTWQTLLPRGNEEAARSLTVLNAILARFVNESELAQANPKLLAQLPDLKGCFKTLPNLLSAVGMLGKDIASQRAAKQKEPQENLPFNNIYRNIGRNDSCPCGSGKKFKRCCLH